MGWAEGRGLELDERLAGVGPIKRMSQCQIEIVQKGTQLGFQVGDGGEVAAADDFTLHDAEHDFDLVQPRTVFGQEHEADAMGGVRQEGPARGL